MVVIAAMIKTVAGRGDELEREFRKLVPKVLQEPGVITYTVHRSLEDPSWFFVYEKYRTKADFELHCSTPHFKEFFQALEPIKDGEPQVGVFTELA